MKEIIICASVLFISTIIQWMPMFHKKIILRRFISAAILLVPCLWQTGDAGLSTYATIVAKDAKLTFVYAAIPSVIIIALTQRTARFKENLDVYPEIRISAWTLKLFAFNLLSWCSYLVAYEFLFRGYLLSSCLNSMPVGHAFIVTTTLYALAHLHKSEMEFFLSVPFGILICYITIATNNVWAAVTLHIALALSNDLFAFRANPHFSFIAPRSKKITI